MDDDNDDDDGAQSRNDAALFVSPTLLLSGPKRRERERSRRIELSPQSRREKIVVRLSVDAHERSQSCVTPIRDTCAWRGKEVTDHQGEGEIIRRMHRKRDELGFRGFGRKLPLLLFVNMPV